MGECARLFLRSGDTGMALPHASGPELERQICDDFSLRINTDCVRSMRLRLLQTEKASQVSACEMGLSLGE